MAKRGRKAKYVLDRQNKPVIGLSFDKCRGVFYNTHFKSEGVKKESFGGDKEEAIFRFRQWENHRKGVMTKVTIPDLDDGNKLLLQTHRIAEQHRTQFSTLQNEDDLNSPPPPIVFEIPTEIIAARARRLILDNPIEAARLLGIPQLANLDALPEKQHLKLSDMLELYLLKPKGRKEKSSYKRTWAKFCRVIKCKEIGEVKREHIQQYSQEIYKEHQKKQYSYSWLSHMFQRVKTILSYNLKFGSKCNEEIQRVIAYCSILVTPSVNTGGGAQPISREDFHKLLSVSDSRWRAILLTSLNCGYYAKDIQDLEKSMIRKNGKYYYIVFPRKKTGGQFKRVNVLWQETIDAIEAYWKEFPSNNKFVFNNSHGGQWKSQNMDKQFKRLREKANCPDVTFSHLRDGASTAIWGEPGISDDIHNIFLGHNIRGERSKYVDVKPQKMEAAAEIIYKEYMS